MTVQFTILFIIIVSLCLLQLFSLTLIIPSIAKSEAKSQLRKHERTHVHGGDVGGGGGGGGGGGADTQTDFKECSEKEIEAFCDPIPECHERFCVAESRANNPVEVNAVCRPPRYLKTNESQLGDFFGSDIAVSGEYMIVSADFRNTYGKFYGGRVYVYKRSSVELEDWQFFQIVDAPIQQENQTTTFGFKVAIDGGVMAVSERRGPPPFSLEGRVHVYVLNDEDTEWVLNSTLQHNQTMSIDFGYSVAVQGTTIIVGCLQCFVVETAAPHGTVSLFSLDEQSNQWELDQIIEYDFSMNVFALPSFGESVDVYFDQESSKSFLAVGSSTEFIDNGAQSDFCGAVRVFEKLQGQESQEDYELSQTIYPDICNVATRFGQSVLIEGNLIIVSQSGYSIRNSPTSVTRVGRVEVFEREDASSPFERVQIIDNPNPSSFSNFGHKIDISGDYLVISDQFNDRGGRYVNAPETEPDIINSGTVYTYRRSEFGVFELEDSVKAPNAETSDFFGSVLKLYDDGARLLIQTLDSSSDPDDPLNNEASRAAAVWMYDCSNVEDLLEFRDDVVDYRCRSLPSSTKENSVCIVPVNKPTFAWQETSPLPGPIGRCTAYGTCEYPSRPMKTCEEDEIQSLCGLPSNACNRFLCLKEYITASEFTNSPGTVFPTCIEIPDKTGATDGVPCVDGNPSTFPDTCSSGVCVGEDNPTPNSFCVVKVVAEDGAGEGWSLAKISILPDLLIEYNPPINIDNQGNTAASEDVLLFQIPRDGAQYSLYAVQAGFSSDIALSIFIDESIDFSWTGGFPTPNGNEGALLHDFICEQPES